MKRFIILAVFCLAVGGSAAAQSKLPELEKVKQIKLLESTRDDVKNIFAARPFLTPDFIPTENANISITYSSGNCENTVEDWNVAQGTVSKIEIALKNPRKPKDLGVDLSKFKKESVYANFSKLLVYHRKADGIAYNVYQGVIVAVVFVPSKEKYSSLCGTARVRNFYAGNSWFDEPLEERRYFKGHFRSAADVTDLVLSRTEISGDENRIAVETFAESLDPTDILTYEYEISGGKLIGNGKKIVWDLSGVAAGTYKISAGVNNGCGICGQTMTKTVVVKNDR